MIIFNIAGGFHGEFSTLPSETYLDESKWVIAEFAEGESFDEKYDAPVEETDREIFVMINRSRIIVNLTTVANLLVVST